MNAVKEALQHAQALPDGEALTHELAVLDREERQLRLSRRRLFGIEAGAKKQLKTRIRELKTRKHTLRRGKKLPYQRMSMEPLTWLDGNGRPRLVLFPLNSPVFELMQTNSKSEHLTLTVLFLFFVATCIGTILGLIAAEFWSLLAGTAAPVGALAGCGAALGLLAGAIAVKRLLLGAVTPFRLPRKLRSCYAGALQELRKQREKKNLLSLSITARFSGMIPETARQRIREAKRHFRRIFILAEPGDWEKQEVKADPLILGWDGKGLWLVGDFDTTPLEHEVKSEFAS